MTFRGGPRRYGVNEVQVGRHHSAPTRDRLEAMMVNSYYGIYQAERCKTAEEVRAVDAQLGGLLAEFGQLGSAFAAPVRAVRRSLRGQRRVACPADAG